jgi:hypothetical protein
VSDTDDLIHGHTYSGPGPCTYVHLKRVPAGQDVPCNFPASAHADPGPTQDRHLIHTQPHAYQGQDRGACTFSWPPVEWVGQFQDQEVRQFCGYPEAEHMVVDRERRSTGAVVRAADVAQYPREPMPDEARKGPVVTLIDAPVDPLGTLAVISGIYTGTVRRSKAEVSDETRRAALEDMRATVLDGPLEAIQFTFLIEGVDRAFTHQAVRNRFSFFGQESLRFAVADDWAQEVPLPPHAQANPDDPGIGIWRKALNQSEDSYNALIGVGWPAEEARGVLVHAITTRYYWTVSLRTLLQEAGKRTCTQAQFAWRIVMAGVAKALRARGGVINSESVLGEGRRDGWQYKAFADLIRPVCYQQGKCGFMAKFDRGCTIRNRVDANERLGRPSSEWHTEYDVVDPSEIVVGVGPKSVVVDRDGITPVFVGAIDPREWAADPAAARVTEEKHG